MFDSIFTERGLSLERLRVLIEVHDAGGIARTAPGKTSRQSQFSRQLRELSEFFGCEVAHRRGKFLKLTSEGARLAELARPFLRELTDFHSNCRSERVEFTVGAGDSLIHWLVIPRLGGLLKAYSPVRFTTMSLRTNEIVRQIEEGRIDFGLIRKNALATGMKWSSLGTLSYVAVVPGALVMRTKVPSFSEIFTKFPIAMQTTDGQFSEQLMAISTAEDKSFRPSLGCQSFPQTLAAVRSGRFAAIIPELAVKELPVGSIHKISGTPLRQLQRDIILVWNPRVTRVRPNAAKVVAELQKALQFP
jgi:DNA-binding transcriptional LysR family regulator